jgi:pSer/pThr/pTyr-binding forkhead associated (FHA) protein
MPPMLVALTEGPNIPLDKPIVLIGRHQECDVQIPSRKISRRHCCLAQVHDYVVVKDLLSTNGVRVNGTRVKEGCLRAGDELTIGNYRYKIHVDGQAAEQPLAKPAAIGLPAPLPSAAQALESCDVPIPIAESQQHGPVPQGLPLVLPVNVTMKPHGSELPDDVRLAPLSGEFRAGSPPK